MENSVDSDQLWKPADLDLHWFQKSTYLYDTAQKGLN